MRDLGGVLGRLTYAAGPLERLHHFLSCVYAWVAVVPGGAYLKPPPAVELCLRWVSKKLKQGGRLAKCHAPRIDRGEIFRADAKAEGEEVVIGAWECAGGKKPKEARWFSVRLNAQNTPWLHCRGEPFRVIAALELLATLYAVRAFMPRGVTSTGPPS